LEYESDGLLADLPSARSHAILPFQYPIVETVPDSDFVGGAVDGTKRPSISGSPEPITSTNSVFGSSSIFSTIAYSIKSEINEHHALKRT
jgi:hypothetical protein